MLNLAKDRFFKFGGIPFRFPLTNTRAENRFALVAMEKSTFETEADNYRLYQSRAQVEIETCVDIVLNSVHGPFLNSTSGLSILDIGPGNGLFAKKLMSRLCVREYRAYEENTNLFEEIRNVVAAFGLGAEACSVRNETFSHVTPIGKAGGTADVVLLSHCLYYADDKIQLVEHALKFLSPGGVLFIFDHWKLDGTLSKTSEWLKEKTLPHNLKIYEVNLSVEGLSSDEKARILKYSSGRINNKETCIVAEHGCLMLESFPCQTESSRKINYEAQAKLPAAIVSPSTVLGIHSCLRAASLGLFGGTATVVGGGHSANCIASNGIAIDMHKWNHVVVDTDKQQVRVGGGATIGKITNECEKHGLLVPLGDRPSVGMGLILQGGINHFMRQFGLACDQILRVMYVSPMGELIETSDPKELFLFRGAGTNFGVVTEVTLQAYPLKQIRTQTIDYVLKPDVDLILPQYSETAMRLPNSQALDGYLYWGSHEALAFSTSGFDVQHEEQDQSSVDWEITCSNELYHTKTVEPLVTCQPSKLFDRELYMTPRFLASGTTSVFPNDGRQQPKHARKLRSLKRCLFLPAFHSTMSFQLMQLVRNAPTQWCYIHFLHGGGAVADMDTNATPSAFGCRTWSFAAVATGRFADGNKEQKESVQKWLDTVVMSALQPWILGVYSADLGPADTKLARRYAFGPPHNVQELSRQKRLRDPLDVLNHACPLSSGDNGTGMVVLFCGRRWAGKDWLAKIVRHVLVNDVKLDSKRVTLASMSEGTKRMYARDNPDTVDLDKLLSEDRAYKESHRERLWQYYQTQRAANPAFDAQCYVDLVEATMATNRNGILLLTGLRDGLEYVRRLAGRPVVLVKVQASDQVRHARGMVPNPKLDASTTSEGNVDAVPDTFWDTVYLNDGNEHDGIQWAHQTLLPCFVQHCVRHIPDTPRPGIVYKDVVGGILRQSFGLPLVTYCMVQQWLLPLQQQDNAAVDAIAVPESSGYCFAAAVAQSLQVPLILLRKGKSRGKSNASTTTHGDNDNMVRMEYSGSNISNLASTATTTNSDTNNDNDVRFLYLPRDSSMIPLSSSLSSSLGPRRKRIALVDDCLASGATAVAAVRLLQQAANGAVTTILCVAEWPDLGGRRYIPLSLQQQQQPDDASRAPRVYSIVQFAGQSQCFLVVRRQGLRSDSQSLVARLSTINDSVLL